MYHPQTDFLDDNIKRWFPALEPYVQITLVELMDHILSTYDAKISDCKFNIEIQRDYLYFFILMKLHLLILPLFSASSLLLVPQTPQNISRDQVSISEPILGWSWSTHMKS